MPTKKAAKKPTAKKSAPKKVKAPPPKGLPAPDGRPWPAGTPVVYCLRTSDENRKSHSNYEWPAEGLATAPDFLPTAECGNGLHGTSWGMGDLSLLRLSDPKATWQVVEVPQAETIDLNGKVKFPRGYVVYSGKQAGAMMVLKDKHFLFLSLRTPPSVDASPAATSGTRSPAATSGNASPAATSGNDSPAATSGNDSPAATSGNASPAATSGTRSPAATSGYASPAATSGTRSPAATSGYDSPAATSGNASPAATSGTRSPAATSGNASPAATSGNASPAATSGPRSPAATSGYDSPAEATGVNCAVATSGRGGRVRTGPGGALAVAYYDDAGRPRFVVGHVGEDGIEPNVWYVADTKTSKLKKWH